MKKSLLALAVLGAFAGAVSAQTSVTVYGIVDAGLNRVDTGVTTTNKLDSGLQSGSRLGFKGAEDLGGGTSAIFALENGFSVDTGTAGQGGRLFGRQAWVGLNGGFGAVKFGRQNTPLRGAVEAIDPFRIGLAGDALRVLASGLITTPTGSLVNADRTDNTINYSISGLGGFSGQAAYSFGEVAGSNKANRALGLGLGYANGPLNVQFAYHDYNVTTAAGVDTLDARTAFLGGTYNFGVLTAHLAYADNKIDTNTAPTTSAKNTNWLAGVTVPFGASTVMASYIRNNLKDVSNANSNQIAVGYTYAMSKRTNLYTSYSRTANDSAVKLNAGDFGKTAAQSNEAWAEVLALAPDANTAGLRAQFLCHWRFAEFAQPGKTSWDLESWRPDVDDNTMVLAGCNPGGDEKG